MMAAAITTEVHEALQDLDVILKHLANPNELAGSDGEQVRALLAQHGLQKLTLVQDQLHSQPD